MRIEVHDMVNMEWNLDTAKEVWLEEGIEKGRQEGQAELARKLIALGVSAETIMKATGFSREQLEAIQN
jgi:predicted transposase/invertase (TIGR01784 family)